MLIIIAMKKSRFIGSYSTYLWFWIFHTRYVLFLYFYVFSKGVSYLKFSIFPTQTLRTRTGRRTWKTASTSAPSGAWSAASSASGTPWCWSQAGDRAPASPTPCASFMPLLTPLPFNLFQYTSFRLMFTRVGLVIWLQFVSTVNQWLSRRLFRRTELKQWICHHHQSTSPLRGTRVSSWITEINWYIRYILYQNKEVFTLR